ncbi:sensor histidine kinase [Paenibacillus cremeus]|uniref:histidine kinase n=1 Tax=Paenibacillus cremeus TaxID=2163881 RepID=A0A559K0A7_9BACL|nr:HAMP domain-containing sensor histidine kinase [Paenibacillus cremeus]TVY05561.1 HAMP domain-containing histidine kinase [Paenibacillus cremeus]
MKPGRWRFRFRFTFFWRLFLSHLIVSLLILAPLITGFAYYMKQNMYKAKTEELSNVSRAVVRTMLKEDEEPTVALQAYRTLLAERKISFILLDKAGEILYRDPKMPGTMRNKAFLDNLRAHMFVSKANDSFVLQQDTDEPLVVVYKPIRPKSPSPKVDSNLFVISPLQGIQAAQQTLNQTLIYLTIFVSLVAIIASFFISHSMSRSIGSLRQSTQQIAAGNYTSRSPVRRSDELGDLASDFNSMAHQLEITSGKLEQYETRRRHFVMDVTHELRTPLTSIRGIIEGLKNGLVSSPEERAKYYGIIEKETFRLIRLINELLDMEKIQSGLITLHKKRTPLHELLEIVAESLEVLAEEKKLHLRIECEPSLLVYGDYDRLTQILINLVKNSIQFTEYGTIALKGYETAAATVIEIADTGRGMSKEELALIWDRFYKADPSRSKAGSETGLGLSIVKQLVEAHHGTITAESTPGLGTKFTITLPLTDSDMTMALGSGE